ncbi:MAG: Na+/H+ antiporter subunit C [Thiotrichales bacterium]|jgi:multisubunit Na+/H+ antiporter MnhC subunit|nr:Na+/H+ antiporter subunit C [Thiotrichales bacterium]MBT3753356.1 Na+/H+ antiporter subunit C [Thiotrichales bacterium]MBT4151938.1 Na+/H+ antiporter subunit C [Thiotrichales bacterium]MBT4260933.1 Na+/H+ antiporter subunit C [Thiotrichales bacterium]MBT4573947.1 Na+/H+ antiporter subunit C [Thiotrichales bacterium]
MLGIILYSGAVALIVIGIAGLVRSTHLFRAVLALVIAESGANLLLMLAGFRLGGAVPIATEGSFPLAMVDPVPQAMVLTAIVIGVGIQALAIALLVRVKQRYGTLERSKVTAAMELELNK